MCSVVSVDVTRPEDSWAASRARHMAMVNTSSSRSSSCSKRFQKAEEGGAVADDARLSIRFHFSRPRGPVTEASTHFEQHVGLLQNHSVLLTMSMPQHFSAKDGRIND